ncbi:hypothetical protein ASF48_17270 [Rathayibacter sp. Leaf299]|uniref:hypothetical protein n=1 Tax=Rathayibacter sp. Leaf299 TaxID=1736328 RepID=UPI0007123E15|nr:hypothetical protein [Rathayibacter sp. Leaf299]KQQ18672.1 hypothetical protein ASF48_17270 [Rathayibacter sp. Leaf299]
MTERNADLVTVPDVVGMPFHVGGEVAVNAGVVLANPDPDGPPIGTLAWPGLFYITSQQPAAGVQIHRWDSVAVEIIEHGTAEHSAPLESNDPLPQDVAHATPEREHIVDVTGGDARA